MRYPLAVDCATYLEHPCGIHWLILLTIERCKGCKYQLIWS